MEKTIKIVYEFIYRNRFRLSMATISWILQFTVIAPMTQTIAIGIATHTAGCRRAHTQSAQ